MRKPLIVAALACGVASFGQTPLRRPPDADQGAVSSFAADFKGLEAVTLELQAGPGATGQYLRDLEAKVRKEIDDSGIATGSALGSIHSDRPTLRITWLDDPTFAEHHVRVELIEKGTILRTHRMAFEATSFCDQWNFNGFGKDRAAEIMVAVRWIATQYRPSCKIRLEPNRPQSYTLVCQGDSSVDLSKPARILIERRASRFSPQHLPRTQTLPRPALPW